VNILCIQETK
jgi:exonuclease III